MDKVFSTRISERVLHELDRLCQRLGRTKKQVIEEAIRLRAASAENGGRDVWAETCGAWERREKPEKTVQRSRKALESSMTRHHRRDRA
jgi:predicted transcriptional regulator